MTHENEDVALLVFLMRTMGSGNPCFFAPIYLKSGKVFFLYIIVLVVFNSQFPIFVTKRFLG